MSNLKERRSAALHRDLLLFIAFTVLYSPLLYSTADESRHTHASLVADVARATPGTSMTVGVLLRMDPGWHTYWVNPGESGLATTVRWTVPPGVVVSDLLWPLPEKTIEAGEVLTYGYSNETMLLAKVQFPTAMPAQGAVKLQAEISWLECQKTCVPGSVTVTLTIPIGEQSTPSPDAPDIARYRAALPRPLNTQDDIAVSITPASDTMSIVVTPSSGVLLALNRADAPDFFPSSENSPIAGRTSTLVTGNKAVIRVPLAAAGRDQTAEIRGVLVYTTADGIRKGVEIVHEPTRATSPLDRQFVTAQSTGGDVPLIMYIGLAIIGGLLLNIMPCVLPVIALKIFGLVKMAGDEPKKVRRLGWMFSLGILASFLVLALIVILLKIAGQQVGWGFQFQEPIFVIVMSALVFAFGLSLFGVFEIRLPGAAVAGVSAVITQQEHTGGKGYAASFAEGVFATIAAYRPTDVAALPAKARRLDGNGQAVHGFSDDGYASLASLYSRETTRDGGCHLDRCLPADDRSGLLAHREICDVNRVPRGGLDHLGCGLHCCHRRIRRIY